MSLKSAVGHLLNGVAEIVNSNWSGKYLINSGIDHGYLRHIITKG